ncbi:hypothetical protein CVT26_005546 [Gymnopilus dilepis]|uniref:Uncharacterized protein n=1 Tax=Gymnopilus dilepis TaxID=231916 RepID=A0A409XZS8_9AGAR|nr:hypothetical protein CVT26_005546 [Gymnopilus dilepis]
MTSMRRVKPREKIFLRRLPITCSDQSKFPADSEVIAGRNFARGLTQAKPHSQPEALPPSNSIINAKKDKSASPPTPWAGQHLASFAGSEILFSPVSPPATHSMGACAIDQQGLYRSFLGDSPEDSPQITCSRSDASPALKLDARYPTQAYRHNICPDAPEEMDCRTTPSNSSSQTKVDISPTQLPTESSAASTVDTPAVAEGRGFQSCKPRPDEIEVLYSGRLSDKVQEQLCQGFLELDKVIQKMKYSTGLSEQQILKRWRPSDPKDLNFWNIYQKYFQVMQDEELGRLGSDNGTINLKKPTMAVIRASYKAFKREEPRHKSILEIFWRFFSNRLRLSDDDLEGHLKAHVYDITSTTAISKTNNRDGAASASRPSNLEPSSTGNAKKPDEGRGRKQRLATVLKSKILDLLASCEVSQLSKSRLPYSDVPTILAAKGYVMENWPEDVPFPCDLPKGKGIAQLQVHQQKLLLDAFNDPSYPLKVVRKYSEAVPPSEPVIIGIPPASESNQVRGRRKFLDEGRTVDRNGPARRVVRVGTRGHSPSCSRSKRAEPCHRDSAENTSPKKRRKGK